MTQGLKRYYGADHLHYITCSCYRRRPLLGTPAPAHRNLFLKVLERVRRRYQFVVVGYVVMPEHFHWLMSEPEHRDPSVVMQVVKQEFAKKVLRALRSRAKPLQSPPVGGGRGAKTRLASAASMTSRVEQGQADREIALHASQPGEARLSARAGAVGLEQFSSLRFRRARASAGKRAAPRGTEDYKTAREKNGEAIGMIARPLPTRRQVRDEWGTPG